MRQFELILPAYNEAQSLPQLVARVCDAAEQAQLTPDTFGLVVVDNGSRDATPEVLAQLRQGPRGSWFTTVTVDHNQGYGHGVLCGLRAASADIVGWSHADLQCDPQDAFTAFQRVREAPTPTLVKGVRRGRNWKDRMVSRVFEACAHGLLNMGAHEINAQPKVFPRVLLQTLKHPPKSFAFDLYTLYQAKKHGYTIATIPVHFPPRVHGASKWAATFVGRYKTMWGMVLYMRQLQQREGRL